jgi:hypothetical protein
MDQNNNNTLPDVGVFSCPCSEGLQLRFWLAHPGVEEIELAKFPRAHPCVAVDRVVSGEVQDPPMGIRQASMTRGERDTPLVVLYKADNVVFS